MRTGEVKNRRAREKYVAGNENDESQITGVNNATSALNGSGGGGRFARPNGNESKTKSNSAERSPALAKWSARGSIILTRWYAYITAKIRVE